MWVTKLFRKRIRLVEEMHAVTPFLITNQSIPFQTISWYSAIKLNIAAYVTCIAHRKRKQDLNVIYLATHIYDDTYAYPYATMGEAVLNTHADHTKTHITDYQPA